MTREYWTIKATQKSGLVVGRLAEGGNYFAGIEGKVRQFFSLEAAAAEVVRWRAMNHVGPNPVTYKIVRTTVRPRGHKRGTWAWACEQLLAGKRVTLGSNMRLVFGLDDTGSKYTSQLCTYDRIDGKLRGACPPRASDFLGTDWEVVP